MHTWSEEQRDEYARAHDANRRSWASQDSHYPGTYRRVEFLLGQPVFAGLYSDPEYLEERYAEVDPTYLFIEFKSRDIEW